MNSFFENVCGVGVLILTVAYMIMLLSSFHKRFVVLYTNILKGIGLELLVSAIISVILVTLTFVFWPIVVGIIGLVVFLNIRKFTDWFHRLIWIIPSSILGTYVMVMGILSWVGAF